MKRIVLGAAAVVAFSVAGAGAGTVIVVDTESFTRPEQSGTATLYIGKGRMRIDSTEGGGESSVIYLTDGEPRFYMIDRGAGTYTEITKADMDRIQRDVDFAVRQYERQIENAPPAQQQHMREVFEQRMGRKFGSEGRSEYQRVSSGVKVGEWTCTQYQGFRGDVKNEEVWAAHWNELGIQRDDFAVFSDLAELLSGVGQGTPAFFQFALDEGERGFPVLVVSYVDGKRSEKSRVVEVRNERFDTQLFEIPEGLTKQDTQTR